MLKIAEHKLEVILANAVFRNPLVLVQNSLQQLDELSAELTEVVRELLTESHRKLSAAYEQIIRIEPHRLLGYKTIELNNLHNLANVEISAAINNCRMQLTAQDNRLSALNPRSVLHRGYSITTNKKTGLLVKNTEDVRIGDYLITELANKNLIESKISKKHNINKNQDS
jgi:exodeoxyribonuclease VII large subunit